MMTQMVLSRGSILPMAVPDVQPGLHSCKHTIDSEDITVMDTKLKIIEILQVEIHFYVILRVIFIGTAMGSGITPGTCNP